MPNLVLISDQPKDLSIQAESKNTFNQFEKLLPRMPQVQSGAVSHEKAALWLKRATEILKPSQVQRLIRETSGFTSQDIRALWAFSKGEYYPTYEASEVYKLKNLEAIRVPEAKVSEDAYLKLALRQVIKEKYNFDDAREIYSSESARDFANKTPWALNIDSYVGVSDENQFVYDIKTDYINKLSTKNILNQSDVIRHHFSQLAASNSMQELDGNYQYNISLSPELAKTISTFAKMDAEGFAIALNLARKAENDGHGLIMKKDSVALSPEIFQEILQIGNSHWQNIVAGVRPDFKKTLDVELTATQKSNYTSIAKKYTVARFLEEKSKTVFAEARAALPEVVAGLPPGFTPPFEPVHVGTRKEFDIDSAVATLAQSQIPEHFYKEVTFDMKALVNAAAAKGVDVEQFKIIGAPVKAKVLDTLDMAGISKSTFESQTHHVHLSGQSRGPVREHIDSIKQSVEEEYTHIESKLINNSALNSEANFIDSQSAVEHEDSVGIRAG